MACMHACGYILLYLKLLETFMRNKGNMDMPVYTMHMGWFMSLIFVIQMVFLIMHMQLFL